MKKMPPDDQAKAGEEVRAVRRLAGRRRIAAMVSKGVRYVNSRTGGGSLPKTGEAA
jgi:hypothetical protein